MHQKQTTEKNVVDAKSSEEISKLNTSNSSTNSESNDEKGSISVEKKDDECTIIPKSVKESLAGWRIYFHHTIRSAGLGFSLLFMTVSRVYLTAIGREMSTFRIFLKRKGIN